MENSPNTLIGERVRFYRTARELSLETLANKLAHRITPQQFARYETGQSRWPADLLIDVTKILGVDIRMLVGLEDGKHEDKDTEEWTAEKYKCLLLRVPARARTIIYRIIDEACDFVESQPIKTKGIPCHDPL